MVLESLLHPKEAEQKPYLVFGLGFLYATLGLFIASWIFRDHAGLVMIILTTIAAIPLFFKTIKYEEGKDLVIHSERKLLVEHGKAISHFLMQFLGMAAAFTFWYVVLPQGFVSTIFGIQTQTIVTINKGVTGHFAKVDLFSKIFLNNVEVLFFCLLFSLLYGAGAFFILAWNASVIGVALGNFIKGYVASAVQAVGATSVMTYVGAITWSALRYLIHGIPEIAGYLVGALAGGILSVAIIKHDFTTKNFEELLLDSTDLVMIALAILFIASAIEVYVTPLLF